MNEYIFYTTEGFTEAPNVFASVENCQVIGREFGRDVKSAMNNLIDNNGWINECGFNMDDIVSLQVLTEQQREDIVALLDIVKCIKNLDETSQIIIKRLEECVIARSC